MPGGRLGSATCDMLFPAAFFAQCPRPGVGTSARAHAFFKATSEIPNRGARIFSGSDQTSSCSSFRESRLAIVISKIWVGLHLNAEGFSPAYLSFDLSAPARNLCFGYGFRPLRHRHLNRNETDAEATLVYV